MSSDIKKSYWPERLWRILDNKDKGWKWRKKTWQAKKNIFVLIKIPLNRVVSSIITWCLFKVSVFLIFFKSKKFYFRLIFWISLIRNNFYIQTAWKVVNAIQFSSGWKHIVSTKSFPKPFIQLKRQNIRRGRAKTFHKIAALKLRIFLYILQQRDH